MNSENQAFRFFVRNYGCDPFTSDFECEGCKEDYDALRDKILAHDLLREKPADEQSTGKEYNNRWWKPLRIASVLPGQPRTDTRAELGDYASFHEPSDGI